MEMNIKNNKTDHSLWTVCESEMWATIRFAFGDDATLGPEFEGLDEHGVSAVRPIVVGGETVGTVAWVD